MMFELTYQCNFRCKHCYVPASFKQGYRHKELKTKEIFSILGQLRDLGCFYLGFTGGEPFLREDIMPILRYARKQGFEVIIYSNGSLINNKIASQLQQLNINKVDITIPAVSDGAFKRVTGVNLRDEVLGAVQLLHKKGVSLGFKTCILKENESEVKKISKFTNSFGGSHRWDNMLFPCLDGSRQPYNYRSRAIIRMLKQLKPKEDAFDNCGLKEIGHKRNNGKLFACGAGITQAAITPAGELKMCLMINYPKYRILETSLEECWRRLRTLRYSIQADKNYHCNICRLKKYCQWCPARAWLYNRTFTICEPDSRQIAGSRRAS